jgi:hypothetical protein
MQKFSALCLALLLTCVWACQKTDFESAKLADHTAEFAFPLFNTNIAVSDLVDNILQDSTVGDTIIVNPDNTILLSYSGDVTESKATDIFKFFITQIPLIVDSSYYQIEVKTPDGISLSKADLSAGNLQFYVYNSLTEPLDVTLYIPQLALNGVPYSYSFQDIAPGAIVNIPEVNLADWKILTTDNLVTIQYDAFLPDGTKVLRIPPFTGSGFPAVGGGMQGLEFSYLEGTWNRTEYELNTDTIEIDINQTNLTGNVKVKNPKVTIKVINSFGFPTRGLIKYLRFKAKNGQLLELVSPLIQQGSNVGIDFAFPQLSLGEVGQSKETIFYFDDTNSNIEEIFNSEPVEMIYQVNGLANAENDLNFVGFITGESSVRLNVKVELLLEGSLKNFGADQSFALDFGNLADTTLFDEAEFKLVTENSMGLTANLQVYFQDELNSNVDSLFFGGPKDVIVAAEIDPVTGNTTTVNRTETFIPFSASRFENLRKKAKRAYLKTAFTTAQDGTVPVKILANQGTVVKMGMKVKKGF